MVEGKRGKGRPGYRSQAGIVYDILKTPYSEGPSPPTRIMYGVRIPYDRLKKLLNQLLENNLVEETIIDNHTYYKLTKKGVDALNELEKVKKLLEQIGIRF